MDKLVPLGDQAVLAYLPDEATALRLADNLRRAAPPWLVDLVQAYTTVALYYDLQRAAFDDVAAFLRQQKLGATTPSAATAIRHHAIPCCYENGPDLERVAQLIGSSTDEVIRLHLETEYTVYAIGFCPGFPYLGYLPEKLSGVPRLESPRLRVEPGSVGLTGRQTGIYTEARPAGWNLVGRTPLELVHVADGYFPLRTGDRLRFQRIDEAEFQRLLGQRL
jgi:inhibitor of KinA